ncbi:C2H2 type zinc finger protein [Phytophthora infestans]|uniref:C2H2 type zinc finger n=1 Tax=Phytophthora infestans TaxID=4787 RepID=A0A833SW59_PHYIN|nr:C2H2 type zinc finger protein [Phytophthora infestans]KAF4147902.1 C2H2 type zinc finger [Phytophthora infestans]
MPAVRPRHWPFSETLPARAPSQRAVSGCKYRVPISEFATQRKPADQLTMLADNIDTALARQIVFRCSVPYCERSLGDSFSLAEHLKKHAGEKRHICPVRTCGRRFSTPGNLSRHKRLHGPVRPLECPVAGCICTFRSENKLSKHMKFHLGSPVHVCSSPGCGKTFSTAGNLNRHIKGHHPELDARKTKLIAANMTLLPVLDQSYDSPTGSDELLQPGLAQNPMMIQMRVPASPASSVSTIDVAICSPAPSSSCASPGASPMTPLDIAMDPEQLDELVSILDEFVKVDDAASLEVLPTESFVNELQTMQLSVLDDMIRFHIDHLQM